MIQLRFTEEFDGLLASQAITKPFFAEDVDVLKLGATSCFQRLGVRRGVFERERFLD